MQTYIELVLHKNVEKNTPVAALDHSQIVITSGPVTLSNESFDAIRSLAMNVLQGSSAKDVRQASVPSTPADFAISFFAATNPIRMLGVLLRISGARNIWRRAPVKLTVKRDCTGVTSGKGDGGVVVNTFVVYPSADESTVFVMLNNDNAGRGQVSAFQNVVIEWELDDHPGVVGSEYVISAEPVTLRDFTNRSNG